jgi:hypothetical protein
MRTINILAEHTENSTHRRGVKKAHRCMEHIRRRIVVKVLRDKEGHDVHDDSAVDNVSPRSLRYEIDVHKKGPDGLADTQTTVDNLIEALRSFERARQR